MLCVGFPGAQWVLTAVGWVEVDIRFLPEGDPHNSTPARDYKANQSERKVGFQAPEQRKLSLFQPLCESRHSPHDGAKTQGLEGTCSTD